MALPKLSHPTYTITLPYSNQSVKFRPWTVAEEKILLMAKDDGQYSVLVEAINQLFTLCVTPALDFETMTSVDAEFLFVHLSSRSVNNIIPISFSDANGNTYKADVDLTKITTHLPKVKNTTITLDEKTNIVLRYPTLIDFVDENDAIKMIARCITTIITGDTTIDPKTETQSSLVEFVSQFNHQNVQKIEEFFADIPYVKCDVPYTDKNGKEQTFELKGMASFFV